MDRATIDAQRQDTWDLVFTPLFNDNTRDLADVTARFGVTQGFIDNRVIYAKNAYMCVGMEQRFELVGCV